MARQGAGHGRQCAYALFHRPSAPAAGPDVEREEFRLNRKPKMHAGLMEHGVAARRHEPGLLRRSWRRIRRPLAESSLVKYCLAWLAHLWLRLVYASNRAVPGSHDVDAGFRQHQGAIFVLWHGQHLLAPRLL